MEASSSIATGQTKQPVDLVLEGGGVKGIALAGAYAVLEEEGFAPKRIAGTSAGAICAALITAGYSAEELHEVMVGLDFSKFMDRGWEDKLPLIGKPVSVIADHGIYEGEFLLEWMRGLLEAKGVKTFGDLVDPEWSAGDDPNLRYRLQVIASDLTLERMLVLPRDADLLGIDPDKLGVAEAVRMSMSIPIFFEPWNIQTSDGRQHTIVDGGILSNFPVWLFDTKEEPRWPTFGLMLFARNPGRPIPAKSDPDGKPDRKPGLVDFGKSLVDTMIEAHDRMYLENATYVRTIGISRRDVKVTDFDLDRAKAEDLYRSGREAATKFLATWDFEDYKRVFRGETEPPGRSELLALARERAREPGDG